MGQKRDNHGKGKWLQQRRKGKGEAKMNLLGGGGEEWTERMAFNAIFLNITLPLL